MIEITEKDVADYERDGVIKIKGALTTSQVEDLDGAITPYLEHRKFLNKVMFGDSLFFTQPNLWKTNPFFVKFVQQPMFINVAAKLLRSSRINLMHDMLFVKSAGCKKKFGWHQDRAYIPIQGEKLISFWMATENVTSNDGGLQFVKGSHLWPGDYGSPLSLTPLAKILPQNWGKGKAENSNVKTCEGSEFYTEDNVVSFDLERGDILAFHAKTQHRSGPNQSNQIDRKGYAVRYTGDDVTYHPDSDTGIVFQLWDANLKTGEKMEGPLYPLLYENGKYLELKLTGPDKGQIWRVLRNQVSSFQSKSADNSPKDQKTR